MGKRSSSFPKAARPVRSLSPEEAELWSRVTATIRPLSREPSEPISESTPPPPQAPKAEAVRPRPRAASPRPTKVAAASAVSGGLDGQWDRKLRSGSVHPDRTVDLHGHNLDRAWTAIDQSLERAIELGERVVLLITGHERRGDPPIERGRIRAAVRDWLSASRHSSAIAAVRGAHPRHGGGGSLYIILRRRKA